jgi:hypothetical protein
MATACRSPAVAPSSGLAEALSGFQCGDRPNSGKAKFGGGSASEKSHGDAESVVEYREKTDVLAELESFVGGDARDDVEVQGYDEDIVAWADAIRRWLKQQGLEFAAIAQLQKGTGLSRGGFGWRGCWVGLRCGKVVGFMMRRGLLFRQWLKPLNNPQCIWVGGAEACLSHCDRLVNRFF